MAMAAYFFNHVGHLGLGVVSLSSVLNSVYHNVEGGQRHQHLSDYMPSICEYVETKTANGKIPLARLPKRVLRCPPILSALPEMYTSGMEVNENISGKVNINAQEIMKVLVADEREVPDSMQISTELFALIKQHGFTISEMQITDDINPVNDCKEEVKETLQVKSQNRKASIVKSQTKQSPDAKPAAVAKVTQNKSDQAEFVQDNKLFVVASGVGTSGP